MPNTIIITSKPNNKRIICHKPPCTIVAKATEADFDNNNSCGTITGNPIIAIKAADCSALAAMAAKKVNTMLSPILPKQLIAAKRNKYSIGLPNKRRQMPNVSKFIHNMSNTLKINLASINSIGLEME